jgi:hypothetical protein
MNLFARRYPFMGALPVAIGKSSDRAIVAVAPDN